MQKKNKTGYIQYYLNQRKKGVKHHVDYTRTMVEKHNAIFVMAILSVAAYIFTYGEGFASFLTLIFSFYLALLISSHLFNYLMLVDKGVVKSINPFKILRDKK